MHLLLSLFFNLFKSKTNLLIENLALRQQLANLKRMHPKIRPKPRERLFWVVLSKCWPEWKNILTLVSSATVLKWHKMGFRLFWAWKSRTGRKPVNRNVKNLVRDMLKANPLWGASRIHGELMKLGINIAERTISTIIQKLGPKKPPQTVLFFFHIIKTFKSYRIIEGSGLWRGGLNLGKGLVVGVPWFLRFWPLVERSKPGSLSIRT